MIKQQYEINMQFQCTMTGTIKNTIDNTTALRKTKANLRKRSNTIVRLVHVTGLGCLESFLCLNVIIFSTATVVWFANVMRFCLDITFFITYSAFVTFFQPITFPSSEWYGHRSDLENNIKFKQILKLCLQWHACNTKCIIFTSVLTHYIPIITLYY